MINKKMVIITYIYGSPFRTYQHFWGEFVLTIPEFVITTFRIRYITNLVEFFITTFRIRYNEFSRIRYNEF